MRRPLWFRALITLWGIWFATALTEPAELFGCPMHSVIPQAVIQPGASQAAPSLHGSTASHNGQQHEQHHAIGAASDDQRHPESPAHTCCTCLGQCCAMAPAEMPRDAYALLVPFTSRQTTAAYAHTARIPQRAAHAHPFANGPPLTTLL